MNAAALFASLTRHLAEPLQLPPANHAAAHSTVLLPLLQQSHQEWLTRRLLLLRLLLR
jgi:hypothetical protein